MKSIAVFVTATILFQTLAPTLVHAARHLQGAEIKRNTRVETADVAVTGYASKNNPKSERERAREVADQAIQWLYRKDDVTVMSRGEIDPLKLTKGWYVHVVYTSGGVKGGATGQVAGKDANRVVIQSRGSALWRSSSRIREQWEIAYSDIDNLVVAEDRREVERWKRRFEGKGLVVMLAGELDLSKLRKGWYAHVVYTPDGVKTTVMGEIVAKDADRILIQPRANSWKTWKIAYRNIDTLAVAKDRRDIDGWREARQVSQRLQEKEPRVRFKASSISKRWVVGRLVKVAPDTFMILTERGFDYVPYSQISNLEVSIGRHRNIDKGIKISFVLGLAVLVPIAIEDARTPGEWQGFATIFTAMYVSLPIFILSTLIGAATESDRWAEVPPQRLNLSLLPTPTRGLRAAFSFNF